MNRREFLAFLASAPPLIAVGANTAWADASVPPADIQKVSEVLLGRAPLDPGVIARVGEVLARRDTNFAPRLAALAKAVGDAGPADRERVVATLSEADAATAIEVISPWYLGYVGSPSTVKAADDSEFVTFLDAVMYEPTADNLIRPTYARAGGDYWAEVPAGVMAPAMDPDIREWGARNPKAAATYATPDPAYVAIVSGKAKTVAEARALLAGATPAAEGK